MIAEIGRDIEKAIALLEGGELIGLPTETVYGLAANGLDATAVVKIFEVKNRPFFDPLILHTSSLEKVKDLTEHIPCELERLANRFWPGPLTLLLPKSNRIPDLVTSGLDRAAFRVPKHPLSLALLERLDFPLAAPSANPFGYVSPTRPYHVLDQLGASIPYILDGGVCEVGLESTILGLEGNEVAVYRKGGILIEDIQDFLGKTIQIKASNSNPAAPGMLQSHYSPRKRLFLADEATVINPKAGFVGFDTLRSDLPPDHQILLSPKADLTEAAGIFFDVLRNLDKSALPFFYISQVPDKGLGRAINDRILRAVQKN